MSKVFPYLILFALIAIVYHLSDWRPGLSTGPGFDAIMDVTVADWDQAVVQERKPVLAFFHEPSATDNTRIDSVIADALEALRGRFKATRINYTANASLAMRYRIEATPTLLVFKDGLVAATLIPSEFETFPALESKLLPFCEQP